MKSTIWIFSLGLDYLSDRLSLPTEYDKNEDLEKTGDNRARQLKLLSGLRFGNYTVHANVLFREFNNSITSHGIRDYDGNVLPLTYYPKSGDRMDLQPGESISWYTRYTEYEVKIEQRVGWGNVDYGLKVMRFEAPSEINISPADSGASGNILMYTDNTLYSVFVGFKSLSHLWGGFYLGSYTPMDLGYGGYRARCDYFEAGSYNPFSFSNRSHQVSSAGTISLQFLQPHVKVEAGLDYGFYLSLATLRDVKLEKSVTFLDEFDQYPHTVNAGERVDLEIMRIEFFWGLYISACLYF
ncbi:MAG: hypothetical protein KBA61_06200 [Spirochaetes bacterium]|nr:hypothetical protein [Spirochaetota bacterium]